MAIRKGSTIRVLIDDEYTVRGKSALPIPFASGLAQRVVEIDSKQLQKSLKRTIGELLIISDEIFTETDKLEISAMKLSLALEASGEVSIVSLAKGSLGAKTGFEVTINRRST